jgi:DNA modification methylase
MKTLPTGSVDLVVTSPPYPMIEMWDEAFIRLNPDIKEALERKKGSLTFELMHQALDRVWDEVNRVLVKGGIVCINIGDATRTIGSTFQLFPSHSRITRRFLEMGLYYLPAVIWRKQTNAPNKFMGSGMLPPGAYVTLEHEFILIFRKGNKREFKDQKEKDNRNRSAFFWEERNQWFSDVWFDIKGTRQDIEDKEIRKRSAAYPFEVVYRIINMFSVKGDWVLDPFLGTGTTTLAAMASARNSLGLEMDSGFRETIASRIKGIKEFSNAYIDDRVQKHLEFVEERTNSGYTFKYKNKPYGFPVMTRQELDLFINPLVGLEKSGEDRYTVTYQDEATIEST